MSLSVLITLSMLLTGQVPDGGASSGPDVAQADGGMAAPGQATIDPRKMPFNRESIRTIMMSHVDEFQACYDASLANKYGKRAKLLEGKIIASFIIDRHGRVKSPEILYGRGTVTNPKLRGCMVRILRPLQFPIPRDHKNHPIQFPYKLRVTT